MCPTQGFSAGRLFMDGHLDTHTDRSDSSIIAILQGLCEYTFIHERIVRAEKALSVVMPRKF